MARRVDAIAKAAAQAFSVSFDRRPTEREKELLVERLAKHLTGKHRGSKQ